MIPGDVSRNGWLPQRADVDQGHGHAVGDEQLPDEVGLGAFGVEGGEEING